MFVDETIVAIYEDFENADTVLQTLLDEGFLQTDVGLAVSDSNGIIRNRDFLLKHFETIPDEDTGFGALLANMVGTNYGLTPLQIPGIGSVVAAGPLVDLLGSATGSVLGGVSAALVHLGIPYNQAGYYTEALARGYALITVHIRTQAAMAIAVDRLLHNHPIILKNYADEWIGFDSPTETSAADGQSDAHYSMSDAIGRFPYVRL